MKTTAPLKARPGKAGELITLLRAGTGLGLSMTYDIVVKQHYGRIDVETEPGSFTKFTILLPRNFDPSENARGRR
jgi:signal transduction histidine kinase